MAYNSSISNVNNKIIAVCRDPFDRFISLFKHIKSGNFYNYFYISKKIENPYDLLSIAKEELLKPNPEEHIRPQYDYINNTSANMLIKIKDLSYFMETVLLNGKYSFSRINSTDNININLNDYSDIRNEIYDLYDDDLNLFKYNTLHINQNNINEN